MDKNIKKLLIANRSEIALRIMATCRARNIKVVTIYPPEDVTSAYVHQADEAYPLEESGGNGFLNQTKIIEIAQQANVDAIHPGYGFLAENASFAQAVIDANIIWIGPSPKNITRMGDKQKARLLMQSINVPVVPGKHIDAQQPTALTAAQKNAQEIGYPIIIKSALGGGGKGMRKATNKEELNTVWHLVRKESLKFFGSTELVIEKFIETGRHVEVQIAGDGKNHIHFFERECSIQRRHQKIIEEAPCIFIKEKTREKLYSISLAISRFINYDSIGTIEFLVTPNEQVYFLEMNTRLQVEHSVTEMITNKDLVDLQITLAESKKLPFRQNEISQNGHAVECRIYSEDTTKNFTPSTGTLSLLSFPHQAFVRYDHCLEVNHTIVPLFDPMIAKITAYGQTREQAINRMSSVLLHTIIEGVATNIPLLQTILNESDFLSGRFSTQWLTKNLQKMVPELVEQKTDITKESTSSSLETLALIAAYLAKKTQPRLPQKNQKQSSSSWRQQRWH